MAAFTPRDPDDRAAFHAHMAREVPVRPLFARAASDNAASLRVLEKSGFQVIGTENSFAPGRNGTIEETIMRKD